MGRIFFCATLLLLAACDRPKDWVPTYPADHLAHPQDRLKEAFPSLQTIFGPSCLWRPEVQRQNCIRMDPPKRWTGIWVDQFEGSQFCASDGEGALTECACLGGGRDSVWLTDLTGERSINRPDAVYRVEFEGRMTTYPGLFGHMGGSNFEVVVDRWVNKERLPDRPCRMTGASAQGPDIRPLLKRQGFSGPLNGRESIDYAGNIKPGADGYQIYTFRGVHRASAVDHGVNKVIVIRNSQTLVGTYNASIPLVCGVGGLNVVCNAGVIKFTKAGPPSKVYFDDGPQKMELASRLKK